MCGQFQISRCPGSFACSIRWTIVSLTDANLGLSNYPVRIVSIEEDDSGKLSVTAEEMPQGVATPPPIQPRQRRRLDQRRRGRRLVNTPLILRAASWPDRQHGRNLARRLGRASGAVDPNWAARLSGLRSTISLQKVTTITRAAPGFSDRPASIGAGYDNGGCVECRSDGKRRRVDDGTQAARRRQTLCLVDGELVGLASATLTAL